MEEKEMSQDQLDVEYRQILRIIKPYIQTINNNHYLAQYRVWLEKLSEVKNDEKTLRNQYLLELARQIQCKHLAMPFTQNPSLGALSPLKIQHQETLQPSALSDSFINKQKMCQQWTEENVHSRSQWPFHKPIRPIRPFQGQQMNNDSEQGLREAQRCVKRSATCVKKVNFMKEIDEQTKKFMEGCTPPRPSRIPNLTLRELDLKKRHSLMTPNPSLGVIHEDSADIEDEDDVESYESNESTKSLSVFGSGDTENKSGETNKSLQQNFRKQGENFEEKINTLMLEINGLKMKSENVNERCENTLKTVQGKSPQETQPEANIKDTTDQEPKEAQEKENSFITTDWKKIVESLQVRLSETQHQNKELNALTSTLHKRIKEIDASKEQVKQEVKKQLLEQHKKEIDNLKTTYSKKIQDLVKDNELKIKELGENFDKQKIEYEREHKDLMKKLEDTHSIQMKEKEREINRLEEIIQKECSRLINEITILRAQIQETSQNNSCNDERILFLQKCITKMDRLFQKSEREYCKQIEKLKQEMENREKAMQIQLQTQKADIISRCSAEKQTEMDIIVQNLEAKYSSLLEMQQNQIEHMKNEDEKIIGELREILDQHDIPY